MPGRPGGFDDSGGSSQWRYVYGYTVATESWVQGAAVRQGQTLPAASAAGYVSGRGVSSRREAGIGKPVMAGLPAA